MATHSAWSRRRHLDRALREATRLHRHGEPARAEAVYRRILADDAAHPGALHGVGLLALQAGRADLAIAHIGQAARLAPENAGYHLDLGLALRERGLIEQARAAFHVAALLDARDATPLAAMAGALTLLGRLPEAEDALRQALALSPGRAALHHGLAMVLKFTSRLPEAADALATAAELDPRDAAARCDLAGVLLEMRAPEAAEREARAALELAPGLPAALNNLGLALQDQDRAAEALAAFQAARDDAPGDLGIRNNLGVALRDLDRNDAALACFEAVRARDPAHASAHLNAATILLMREDYARGWEAFEWRDRVQGAAPSAVAGLRWRGEKLAGRTLLVHAEMGLGDTIQFCRFVPRIGGGRVKLLVPAALRRLLATLAPAGHDDYATSSDQTPGVDIVTTIPPAYDLHCPLLSLPRALGLEEVGSPTRYLHADPALAASWRERVAVLPGKRVGLSWAGSPGYSLDRRRSLPGTLLSAFTGIAGVSLVSLQKGGGLPHGLDIADWTAELGDLADTAALIEALDVVVSVDTAIAHLAGALGKPVLLLDRFAGDWRWLRGREDSPWYPSLRVFRQAVPGDWTAPLAAIAAALECTDRRQ